MIYIYICVCVCVCMYIKTILLLVLLLLLLLLLLLILLLLLLFRGHNEDRLFLYICMNFDILLKRLTAFVVGVGSAETRETLQEKESLHDGYFGHIALP